MKLRLKFSEDEFLVLVDGLNHASVAGALKNTTEVLALAINPLKDHIFIGGYNSVLMHIKIVFDSITLVF